MDLPFTGAGLRAGKSGLKKESVVGAQIGKAYVSAFFQGRIFRRNLIRAGLGCGHVSGHDEQSETIALRGFHPTGAEPGPPARAGRNAGTAG